MSIKTELALLIHYERPTLTGPEVAELLGIGDRTLENQIYNQQCPIPMFKVGSKWAAHVADVAAYIDTQRAEAMKELQAANSGGAKKAA